MISQATASLVVTRLQGAPWLVKSEAMHAALAARDDDHFWELLNVRADPDIVKVGPKGYIHGWIFVGAPGVGAEVFHPHHGKGVVTGHDGKHATVKFASGKTQSFEAREGKGKGKLVERAKQPTGGSTEGTRGATRERMEREKQTTREQRAKWDAHNANRVVTNYHEIKNLNDEDLKGVDQELTRRATAIGRPGEVGKVHQKVKDELARRGGVNKPGGGKTPGVDQEKSKEYEAARDAATRYDATEPPKAGSALRTYEDPEKQKEAIRLHTAARRLAPDAKSKKYHTDQINRYKGHLAQAEHNQELGEFAKNDRDLRDKIKGLKDSYALATAEGQQKAADLHNQLADLHEKHGQSLKDHGYGGYAAHHNTAERLRERADFHQKEADELRERTAATHAKIKEQMPAAEAKVKEWDDTARSTGKKEDIARAVSGHRQIAQHAAVIGDQKRVDEHNAAAEELGKLTPARKPRTASPKKPVEGVPEDEKIDTPWGRLHPADVAVQHSGVSLSGTKQHQDAIRELDRRGATPEGRDMVSRARRKVAEDLKRHEAYEKEYNKPGGRGDMVKAKQEADRLSEEADKKGTAAAHEAAAAANRRALTLSYQHEPGQSLTHQHLSTRAKLHEMKAADQRTREPKPLAQRRTEYQAAASRAKQAEFGTSGLDRTGASHDRAAAAHDRAAAAAVTDKQRAMHEAKAKTFREQAENLRSGKDVETGGRKQTPDELSKKAKRTGTPQDHLAAFRAQQAAGNRSKADEHRKALEQLDNADEAEDDAQIHADAAAHTHDPDAHKAAADAYDEAADHLDGVPGARKREAALRAKAQGHRDQAADIEKKTADYVQAFTTANRATHAADRSGKASAHREAAAAQRKAAARAMTVPQRRHHEAEAARHERAAQRAS